jgi:hypothetical protein
MIENIHPLVVETRRFLHAHSKGDDSRVSGQPISIDTPLMLELYPYWLSVTDGGATWGDKPLPNAQDLAAVQRCLPVILTQMGDSLPSMQRMSILAGLRKYDCWRNCLVSDVGAYALAGAIVRYIDDYWDEGKLDRLAAPHVCALLNAWLKPSEPWEKLPGVVTLCQSMFGTAWCVLSLPDDCLDVFGGAEVRRLASTYYVDQLVLAARPPFLPGLCQFQLNIQSAPLPELGCAP